MDYAQSLKYANAIQRISGTITACISLTKPNIQLLLLVTAFASLAVEGSLLQTPWKIVELSIWFAFAGGSAKAFNQILERGIDGYMSRTKNRPLPAEKISPEHAFIFASAIGLISIIMLWFRANYLTSILTLITIIFYGIIYTLYLKPLTRWNTLIGGVTGAMAPITAWAATGSLLTWKPVLMAAIILFWSPPHFYSLSMYYRKDYENSDVKVFTRSSTDEQIWRHIFIYTIITVCLSFILSISFNNAVMFISIVFIGFLYIFISIILSMGKTERSSYANFIISILYLFLFFAIVACDVLVTRLL